jgi:aminopeptidase N
MWIQEGICSFGDALMTLELEGEEAYQLRMGKTARNTQNLKPVVAVKDANSGQVYQPDIYGKGAFFMHTLRYILGDSIFFPTLKRLATDPQYTYDNLVTTDDVQQLFSWASGKQLEDLFTLFLRTTNKLEIQVKQTADEKFLVKVLNLNMPIPLEVVTDTGIQKIITEKNGNIIKSKSVPVIDPKVFYIKKVILE